jgi:hypothetical protein
MKYVLNVLLASYRDVDKVANNPEEAFRQALILQQMQKQAMENAPPQAAVGHAPMGTGGGTIGVGQAPVPGEQGAPTGGGPTQAPQQQQQPAGQGGITEQQLIQMLQQNQAGSV